MNRNAASHPPPIRVGIIGAGAFAREWHVPDIRRAGGEVVAFADAVQGRAAEAARALGVAHAHDDWRDLVANDEVDLVAICTPCRTHAELAVAARRAGKHVYLEKPPTLTAAEMRDVAEADASAPGLILAGCNTIYLPEYQVMKACIDRGELGTVYAVECFKSARSWLPAPERRRRFVSHIHESVSHRIDQVLYFLDSPPVRSVSCRAWCTFPDFDPGAPDRRAATRVDPDNSDMMAAMIRFGNGCTCLLRDSVGPNFKDELVCNLFGDKAGGQLHPVRIFGSDGTDRAPEVPDFEGRHTPAYAHFFACIREGRTATLSPASRAVRVMELIDLLRASAARDGAEITPEEVLP